MYILGSKNIYIMDTVNSGSMSSTESTFKELEQDVQYTYRLYKATRDCALNKSTPSRKD